MSITSACRFIVTKLWLIICFFLLLIGLYSAIRYFSEEPVVDSAVTLTTQDAGADFSIGAASYEIYTARVDRVEVVFEQRDYTAYRLTTNGLVREGELNTERGFENDTDATVYVLNWQQPEGKQMRYVRLTNEPNLLYLLDSEGKIIRGNVLVMQTKADI